MRVTRCTIHGRAVGSLDDLYDELAGQLAFPPHFGRNLDALWDVLVTDVAGPVELVWEDAALSRVAMGEDFPRVATLFADLAKERADITVSYH